MNATFTRIAMRRSHAVISVGGASKDRYSATNSTKTTTVAQRKQHPDLATFTPLLQLVHCST